MAAFNDKYDDDVYCKFFAKPKEARNAVGKLRFAPYDMVKLEVSGKAAPLKRMYTIKVSELRYWFAKVKHPILIDGKSYLPDDVNSMLLVICKMLAYLYRQGHCGKLVKDEYRSLHKIAIYRWKSGQKLPHIQQMLRQDIKLESLIMDNNLKPYFALLEGIVEDNDPENVFLLCPKVIKKTYKIKKIKITQDFVAQGHPVIDYIFQQDYEAQGLLSKIHDWIEGPFLFAESFKNWLLSYFVVDPIKNTIKSKLLQIYDTVSTFVKALFDTFISAVKDMLEKVKAAVTWDNFTTIFKSLCCSALYLCAYAAIKKYATEFASEIMALLFGTSAQYHYNVKIPDEELQHICKIEEVDGDDFEAQGFDPTVLVSGLVGIVSTVMFGHFDKSMAQRLNAQFTLGKNMIGVFEFLIRNFKDIVDVAYCQMLGRPYFAESQLVQDFHQKFETFAELLKLGEFHTAFQKDPTLPKRIILFHRDLLDADSKIRVMKSLTPYQLHRWQSMLTTVQKWHDISKASLMTQELRVCPVWVHLMGEPGIGKTTCINMIASAVYYQYNKRHKGPIERSFLVSDRYERKLVNEYWDGYNGQWLTTMDDIYQTNDKEARRTTSLELIHAINTNAYPLHMSDIAEKATTNFQSKLVITTSNTYCIPNDIGITEPAALVRRCKIPVVMTCRDKTRLSTSCTFEDITDNWIFDVKQNWQSAESAFSRPLEFLELCKLIDEHMTDEETRAETVLKPLNNEKLHDIWTDNYMMGAFKASQKIAPVQPSMSMPIVKPEVVPIQLPREQAKPIESAKFVVKPPQPGLTFSPQLQQIYNTLHNQPVKQEISFGNPQLQQIYESSQEQPVKQELIFRKGKFRPTVWVPKNEVTPQMKRVDKNSILIEDESDDSIDEEEQKKVDKIFNAQMKPATRKTLGKEIKNNLDKKKQVATQFNVYYAYLETKMVAQESSITKMWRYFTGAKSYFPVFMTYETNIPSHFKGPILEGLINEQDFEKFKNMAPQWLYDWKKDCLSVWSEACINFEYDIWEELSYYNWTFKDADFLTMYYDEVMKQLTPNANGEYKVNLLCAFKLLCMTPGLRCLVVNCVTGKYNKNIFTFDEVEWWVHNTGAPGLYPVDFADKIVPMEIYCVNEYLKQSPVDYTTMKEFSFLQYKEWTSTALYIGCGMIAFSGIAFVLWKLFKKVLGYEAQSVDKSLQNKDRVQLKRMRYNKPVAHIRKGFHAQGNDVLDRIEYDDEYFAQPADDREFSAQALDQINNIANNCALNSIDAEITYANGDTFISCLFFIKGTMAFTTKHSLSVSDKIVNISLYARKMTKGSLNFAPHQFRIQFMKDRDLARIIFDSSCPSFRNVTHLLKQPTKDTIVSKPARVNWDLKMFRGEQVEVRTYTRGTRASIQNYKCNTRLKTQHGDLTFVNEIWYEVKDCEGVVGDCGHPYVNVDPTDARPIMGIHVGGLNNTSMCVPILENDYNQEDPEMPAQMSLEFDISSDYSKLDTMGFPKGKTKDWQSEVEPFNVVKHVNLGLRVEKHLKKKYYMPTKTNLIPSPLQEILYSKGKEYPPIYPITKKPAQLSRDEQPTPYTIAVTKYGDIMVPPMDVRVQKYLDDDRIFEGLLTPETLKKPRRRLTYLEAIVGCPELGIKAMDLTTAIGAPLNLYNKKTSDCIKVNHETGEVWTHELFMQQIERERELLSSGVLSNYMACDTLKDELREIPRVEAYKTRLFDAGSKTTLVQIKMLLGHLFADMEADRRTTDVQVGVNVHSVEWTLLYQRLMKHLNSRHDKGIIAGDFERWDKTMLLRLAACIARFFILACGYEMTDSEKIFIQAAVRSAFLTLHVSPYGFYRVRQGGSSGHFWTSIINTIYNSVIHRTAFNCLCPDEYEWRYNEFVQSIFYGDDSFGSVDELVRKYFNMETLSKFFLDKLGMSYTSSDKGEVTEPFTTIDKANFLKRKFGLVTYKGQTSVMPQLDQDSIMSSVMWMNKAPPMESLQALKQTFDSCMMEWFYYGHDAYEQNRRKLVERANILLPQGYFMVPFEERWGKWVGGASYQ